MCRRLPGLAGASTNILPPRLIAEPLDGRFQRFPMEARRVCSVFLIVLSLAGVSCQDNGPSAIAKQSTLPSDSTPKLARTLDSLTLTVLEAEVLEHRMPWEPVILPPGDTSSQSYGISCRIRFALFNESMSLFFDSLSASVGDVYLAKPHKWVGRFAFWCTGFGRLMPGECDTLELQKTAGAPYTLPAISWGGQDSVAIFVLLRNDHGDVKVLATDYIRYQIAN